MAEDDRLVEEQERAAAAEAARLGGAPPEYREPEGLEADEAQRPVREAGGGESEGFELAEQKLVENAGHGEGNPENDAFSPENIDAQRATGVAGEPDEEDVTEKVRDPDDPDSPLQGPDLAASS